ncbi:copper chaperone PCu(A)C [Vibrio hepatarius]|jgi:copper(I)-binding protein|uniref:Copper resistance protein CopZ n=1 Tax=Vibrio hepatarius TaxID=171383 RepID=A0A0M0HWC9_9VIBR|nr:copper chaperone PCu(A)C [Vibrio hepatarius]KOO05933.1 copper resistance protein CopZ [Vibrio hepatarius]
MNKYLQTLLLSAFTLFSAQTLAHEYNAGDIEIDHPWSREAPPTATVIAGFFQLKNNAQQDDYLINASTPVAKRVEIHTHEMSDGMMHMKQIDRVKIAAQETVMFKPGGYHLMIFNPEKAYKQGERFPMTLTFQNAGEVQVELAVEKNGHVHAH